MIREISISFIDLVGQVDWMDDNTKPKAKDKVNTDKLIVNRFNLLLVGKKTGFSWITIIL